MPGRGTLEKEKPPIFGMVQRGGAIILHLLANVRQTTIKPLLLAGVALGSLINTDEYAIYGRCRSGVSATRPLTMVGASMPETKMDSAKSTSTPWKVFGRCCAPGCGRTAASRRRSCPTISPSSNSCTTPDVGAKPYSEPCWPPCCPPPRNPNRASFDSLQIGPSAVYLKSPDQAGDER